MEGYVKTACKNSESVKKREGNSSQRAGSSSCWNELCLYRLSQSGYPPVPASVGHLLNFANH